jgi:hypothetical protein
MKNTLHTPGPWKHDPNWGIIKHGKSEICALHSGNLANARLIASAPDLLVALESLLKSSEVFGRFDAQLDAREAIRKAKGEA